MKAVTRFMDGRRLPGLIAALALLLNLVLPAFQAQEAYAAPFDDVVICTAHQIDDAPTPEQTAAKLCAMCLMLRHQGAFAPSQPVALPPSPEASATVLVALAAAPPSAGVAARPFAPRAPPAAV